MSYLLAILIFLVSVTLALLQPRIGRFRVHHGWAAWLGAIATIAVLLVPPTLAFNTVIRLLPPLATIAGLMVITTISDRAGLLSVQASWMARVANGSPLKLFTLLFFSGAAMGSVFTNDAAVLLLTPLAVSLADNVADDSWSPTSKIPFVFAILHIGNLCGPLVISNPINIIVANLFDIEFGTYAAWMVLPATASMLVTFAGLLLYFRKEIPKSCLRSIPLDPDIDHWMLRVCGGVIALTLVGFFSEDLTGIPTWPVAIGGALLLLMVASTRGHSVIETVRRGVGWDVLAFVSGIFIVVLGLRNAGLAHDLGNLLNTLKIQDDITGIFSTSLVAGSLSSLMNNHPTAHLMSWALDDMQLPAFREQILVFAALIGGDLGPKMLPIGSLAALMWFRMLRERGIDVRYRDYIRIGVPVTLVAIVVASAVLALEVLIIKG